MNEFPKKKRYRHSSAFIDAAIYVAAIGAPLAALPQALKVWQTQSAHDISFISWASLALLNMFWIAYGLAHKDKPILITNILWIAVNSSIAIAAILFA